MVEGPFGGPRPFASDRKTVIVLAGIDGELPPPDIRVNLQQLMEDRINRAFDLELGSLSVALTTNRNPSRQQKELLGMRTLHLQQYDVETPWKEITKEKVSNIEFEVKDQIRDMNFNLVGTQTTVV